jgi:hypothetical protein
MHTVMQKWEDWIANAPESYTEDGVLSTHIPITVTSRYGQNQPLGTDHQEAEGWWDKMRDFTNIRFICAALATDIGYVSSLTLALTHR